MTSPGRNGRKGRNEEKMEQTQSNGQTGNTNEIEGSEIGPAGMVEEENDWEGGTNTS
jgi:hypothetical protein